MTKPNLEKCLNTLAKVSKGDRDATIALTLLAAALGTLRESIEADLEMFIANGRAMYLLIECTESEKP